MPVASRDLADLGRRADEDRRDQSLRAGLDRAGERGLLAGMRDRGRDRLEALASLPAAVRTFRFRLLAS